jgi:hypothetical protein
VFFSGLALLASAPSCAQIPDDKQSPPINVAVDDTRPGLRLSAGVDVFRAPGTVVVNGRYGGTWGAKLGFWVHDGSDVYPRSPHVLVGADYMLTFWKKFRGGAGIAWLDEENNKNGTRWNLDFTVAYDLSERVFLEYRHQSHAAMLGVSPDKPNNGWNFIGAGYTF